MALVLLIVDDELQHIIIQDIPIIANRLAYDKISQTPRCVYFAFFSGEFIYKWIVIKAFPRPFLCESAKKRRLIKLRTSNEPKKLESPFLLKEAANFWYMFFWLRSSAPKRMDHAGCHFSGAALGQEKMYQENLGLPGCRSPWLEESPCWKRCDLSASVVSLPGSYASKMLQTCLGADFFWIPEGQMIISPKKIHNSNLFFATSNHLSSWLVNLPPPNVPQKNATSNHLSSWLVNLPPPNVPPPRKRCFIRPY